LKSVSRGYASLDYHFAGFWTSDLVKVDFLVPASPSMPFRSLATAIRHFRAAVLSAEKCAS